MSRAPQTVAIPLLAALAAYAVMLFAPQVLNDGDTYWHLATGDWILAHRVVPHADPFSHTMPGAPWQAHEWLSEVFMALAFKAGGWGGLLVLMGGAVALATGLLAARLAKSLGGLSLVVVLVVGLAVAGPSLLARPHVLTLPILVAWVIGLLSAREEGRAPRLWLAPLVILWANMHGGYVLGLALIGPFALEALIAAAPSERWKVVRDWGLFGVVALVCAMVTPHGPMGLLFPFQLMGMTTLPIIQEWRGADFSKLEPLEVALLATLFVGFSRGVRIPVLRLLVLLLLLHMSLQHVRHQIVLAVVAPMLLAPHFALALDNRPGAPADRRVWALWSAVGIAVLFALAALRLSWPVVRDDAATTPKTALAHVPATLRARPVFNEYGFGGYLVFSGVRPYIDGRADMYGDAFMRDYGRITAPEPAAVDAAFARYGIAWTLLQPDHPMIRLMDARPGWKRLYADDVAVIHVREDAARP